MSLARFFVFLILILMLVGVVMKWRSGTPFERYRNWRGQWVSIADAPEGLVLVGLILLVIVGGFVWSRWDRRREERFLKAMNDRKDSGR